MSVRGREEDNGKKFGALIGTQLLQDFEATHTRQIHVEQNELGHQPRVAPGVPALANEVVVRFATLLGYHDLVHLVHDTVSAKGVHSEDDLLLVILYKQYRLLLFHARRPHHLAPTNTFIPTGVPAIPQKVAPGICRGRFSSIRPSEGPYSAGPPGLGGGGGGGGGGGWLAYRLTGILLHLLLGRPHARVFGVLGLALIF